MLRNHLIEHNRTILVWCICERGRKKKEGREGEKKERKGRRKGRREGGREGTRKKSR
jgi:hypothetical protein